MKKLLVGAFVLCSMFNAYGADDSNPLAVIDYKFDQKVLERLSLSERDLLSFLKGFRHASRPGTLGPKALELVGKLQGLVNA